MASSSDPYGSVRDSEHDEPSDDSDRISEDLLKSSTQNSDKFPGTTPLGDKEKSKDLMEMEEDSEESDIEAKIDADLNMDTIKIKSLTKKNDQKISVTKMESSKFG